MAKKNKLRFRSSRNGTRIKSIAWRVAASLLVFALGFLSAMLILPHFANEKPVAPADSDSVSSETEGNSSDVSSDNSKDTGESSDAGQTSSVPDVPETAQKGIRAIYIPPSSLDESSEANSYISLIKGTDINAVILDVKDDSGYLYYPSEIEIVKKVGNISEINCNYKQNIKKFHDAGIYVIGKITCFKDNVMPRNRYGYRAYSVLTDSNVNWYFMNTFWMDPYKKAPTDYICGIIAEAALLGFDEIMLDEGKFPDAGPTYMLVYDDQGVKRSDALTAFINKCADTAHKNGMKASLSTPWKYLTDALNEESGQQYLLSKLEIDYFSPDFTYSSFSGMRSVEILGSTVTQPLKKPFDLMSKLKDAFDGKQKGKDLILRPLISPSGQSYQSDLIISVARLFQSDAETYFCYYDEKGVYKSEVLTIK